MNPRRPVIRLLLAATTLASAGFARAQEATLRDLCPERPGRATPPCIVDVGRLMLEADLFDVTRDRGGGVTRDTTIAASPHLRLGLTPNIEAGITLAPWVEVRTRGDPATPARIRGAGDTTLDLKLSLANPGGDAPSFALLPFVSLPTAQHGLGAGGFQGGLIAPMALALPAGLSLSLAPEIDVVRDGPGRVEPVYVAAAALSRNVGAGVTGGVELWGSAERSGSAWTHQATADLTLAWIPKRQPNLQLDGGANFGLTRQTPAVEAYVGLSRRF